MDLETVNNPQEHKKTIFRVVLLLFIVLVVVLAGLGAWNYFITQKVVTLNPSDNTLITIGTHTGEGPNIGRVVAETSVKKSIRLKPGYYSVKYSSTKDFKNNLSVVKIDRTTELKTPKLDYTQSKLDQLVVIEKNQIQQALAKLLDTSGYTVKDDKLYSQADWYSARLIYKDDSKDSLRVVLRKDGDKWTLATKPSFILSIVDYPNIPQEVIRGANKAGFY